MKQRMQGMVMGILVMALLFIGNGQTAEAATPAPITCVSAPTWFPLSTLPRLLQQGQRTNAVIPLVETTPAEALRAELAERIPTVPRNLNAHQAHQLVLYLHSIEDQSLYVAWRLDREAAAIISDIYDEVIAEFIQRYDMSVVDSGSHPLDIALRREIQRRIDTHPTLIEINGFINEHEKHIEFIRTISGELNDFIMMEQRSQ